MIRSVTPGDLLTLRRKPRHHVVLHNEALLAAVHQPFWFALRCFAEGNSANLTTLALHDKRTRALVQARGRRGRPEQDIIYLSVQDRPRGPHLSDHDVWYRLLEQTCQHAGQQQIQRLYATLWEQQGDLHEIFRQLSFQSYRKRLVLQLAGPDWDQGTSLAKMRPQTRQDSWAIHKLYGLLTPHLVQYAEARTARNWTLPLSSGWSRMRRHGWVLGPSDNLEAYLHLLSGQQAHVLNVLIHADIRSRAVDVLRFGLAQIHDDKPVYLVLPAYQHELLDPAERLGFQPMGEQIQLMKATTVPVRRPILLSAFEPTPESPIVVPQISVPREDAHAHARTASRDE